MTLETQFELARGKIEAVRNKIQLTWGTINIVPDSDADGIYSAISFLEENSDLKSYSVIHYSSEKTFNEDARKACAELNELTLFLDCGGKKHMLEYYLETKDTHSVIIFDHHEFDFPIESLPDNVILVNPVYCTDGTRISTAMLMYRFMEYCKGRGVPNPWFAYLSIYSDYAFSDKSLCKKLRDESKLFLQTGKYPKIFNYLNTRETPSATRIFASKFLNQPMSAMLFQGDRGTVTSFVRGVVPVNYLDNGGIGRLKAEIRDFYRGHAEEILIGEVGLYYVPFTAVYTNETSLDDTQKFLSQGRVLALRASLAYEKLNLGVSGVIGYFLPRHDGALKGSFRSREDTNLLDLLKEKYDAGGHKAAFGLDLHVSEFEDFCDYLASIVQKIEYMESSNTTEITILNWYEAVQDMDEIVERNEFEPNHSGVYVKVLRKDVYKNFRTNYFNGGGGFSVPILGKLEEGKEEYFLKPVYNQRDPNSIVFLVDY